MAFLLLLRVRGRAGRCGAVLALSGCFALRARAGAALALLGHELNKGGAKRKRRSKSSTLFATISMEEQTRNTQFVTIMMSGAGANRGPALRTYVALASGVWAERIGLWREVWPADSFGAVATGLRRVRSWPVQMSLRMVGGVSVIKAVIIATIWAMGSLLLFWWLKSE